MTKFKIYFCSIILLAFNACSSSNEESPNIAKPSIELSTENLQFNDVGGEHTVNITSSKNWVASHPTWLSLSPNKGTEGKTTLSITARANETYEDRTSSIEFTSETVNKSITVLQKKKDAILLTQDFYSIKSEENVISVEIKSNVDFKVTIPKDAQNWVSQSKTRSLTTHNLQFIITENPKTEKRIAKIVFEDKTSSLKEILTIEQDARGESTFEQSNALAYIKESSNTTSNIAITSNLAFTNNYLNTLSRGSFYFLDFTIHTKDGQNTDGSYIARNVTPSAGNGEPVVTGRYIPASPNPTPEIYPTQMNVSLFSPYTTTVDDKWVFTYECLAYEEDTREDIYTKRNNIRLVATFLKEDQELGSEEGSKPLGENKIIIRLYLERYEDREIRYPTKAKISHRGVASVDLTAVRHELENIMQSSKDNALGIIQFKYLMQKNKDGEIKDEALGSLNEERPDFYMIID